MKIYSIFDAHDQLRRVLMQTDDLIVLMIMDNLVVFNEHVMPRYAVPWHVMLCHDMYNDMSCHNM